MSALIQQTEEWLEFRKNKIGASDASVIMETSPWKTPYQLWCEKMGLNPDLKATSAMKRGVELEDQARLMFSLDTGISVSPKVIVHPTYNWMMASMDGVSDDNKQAVEIKCPGQEDHAKALQGVAPEKYVAQLQHQLEVLGLDELYYYSFDGEYGVALKVYRDDRFIKKMLKKEEEFYECMQSFTAPKFTNRDYNERSDDLWLAASLRWKSAVAQQKALEFQEKELRESLICMSNGQNTKGGGVSVSKILRKGNVDYAKVPELNGVDLEQYRKGSSEYWKITEEK